MSSCLDSYGFGNLRASKFPQRGELDRCTVTLPACSCCSLDGGVEVVGCAGVGIITYTVYVCCWVCGTFCCLRFGLRHVRVYKPSIWSLLATSMTPSSCRSHSLFSCRPHVLVLHPRRVLVMWPRHSSVKCSWVVCLDSFHGK